MEMIERFILAHSFRGSVHAQLAPLFWVCGEAEHYGRNHMVHQSCLTHSVQKTKGEEVCGPHVLFLGMPPIT
jgi:hypothetical protein